MSEASENETVEAVLADFRKMPMDVIVDANANFVFNRFADRFESAWRREKELIGTSDWTQCAICQTNKTGEGYGDIPPPVGDDDECDSCEIANRLRSGKQRQHRNCDRFASYKEAVGTWNAMSEYEREKHNQSFKDWLFAPVEKEGMK